MADFLKDFLEKTLPYVNDLWHVRPPVICHDGFRVSIQASAHHYCSPRFDCADHYDSYELGFPSRIEPLLMDYCDEPHHPTKSIYCGVPAEIVEQVIEKHGGFARLQLEAGFGFQKVRPF